MSKFFSEEQQKELKRTDIIIAICERYDDLCKLPISDIKQMISDEMANDGAFDDLTTAAYVEMTRVIRGIEITEETAAELMKQGKLGHKATMMQLRAIVAAKEAGFFKPLTKEEIERA